MRCYENVIIEIKQLFEKKNAHIPNHTPPTNPSGHQVKHTTGNVSSHRHTANDTSKFNKIKVLMGSSQLKIVASLYFTSGSKLTTLVCIISTLDIPTVPESQWSSHW